MKLWRPCILVQGGSVPAGGSTGRAALLQDLAQRMKACRYGVVFFGLGLSMLSVGQHNVEQLLLLVHALNDYTRFAPRMRVPGDVPRADTVLIWQTGYPFAVNLARISRYNPESIRLAMLERDEVDACLLVGSEGVARFSVAAKSALRQIPTIVLDYPAMDSLVEPTVRFTTAVYGIHRPGTAYRMDGVPIRLRAFLPTQYPTDAEVLKRIEDRIVVPKQSRPVDQRGE